MPKRCFFFWVFKRGNFEDQFKCAPITWGNKHHNCAVKWERTIQKEGITYIKSDLRYIIVLFKLISRKWSPKNVPRKFMWSVARCISYRRIKSLQPIYRDGHSYQIELDDSDISQVMSDLKLAGWTGHFLTSKFHHFGHIICGRRWKMRGATI